MATKRGYRMAARAEATAATRQRVIESVLSLHEERYADEITLDDIAVAAGVTVPTVLRHFGSKEQLLWAATELTAEQVREQRFAAPVGDIGGAVDNLLDHYDERGRVILRLLAQEERVPQLRQMLDRGRVLHREWVERTFAPLITSPHDVDKLVVITDVYVWKLLAVDRGHDRDTVGTLLVQMLEAVLKGRR